MIKKTDIGAFSDRSRILSSTDDFIYLLPCLGLRNYISNYTITFPNNDMISSRYTVIPHGSATLVFSCSNDAINGSLFGPASVPCIVGEDANKSDMLFIIEFKPAGLYSLTKIKQQELTDKVIPFDLINTALNRLIAEFIENARNLHELLNNIDKLLYSNLRAVIPPELKLSVQKIIENKGNLTIKELADCAFYSERHLNRIFNRYLGINAKTFSRLVRINKSIKLLSNFNNSLISICISSEFYDLSHFIHDFKAVCGITPQEYRNNMSDFYSEIAKF